MEAIKHYNPKELKPAKYNPRTMSEEESAKLKRSMEEFGQVLPVVVNTKKDIIGGHHITEEAIKLGWKTVWCREVDLKSEDKEKLLNIALNKISGQFDQERLDSLISELAKKDSLDLFLSGFDSQELDEMIKRAGEVMEGEPKKEDFNIGDALSNIKKPITKPGDVIELGNHRLICGDSTDPKTYQKLLNGEQVDLIFTDPPYNVAYKSESKNLSDGRQSIKNDDMSQEEFAEFCNKFFDCYDTVLKKGGAFYICSGWGSHPDFVNSIRRFKDKWNISTAIIWDKQRFNLGWQDYKYRYEMIIYGFKTGAPHYFVKRTTQSDYWEGFASEGKFDLPEWAQNGARFPVTIGDRQGMAYADEGKIFLEIGGEQYMALQEKPEENIWQIKKLSGSKMVHPTEKPIEVPMRAIRNSTKRNEIVLDTFGGSGSTLIAAEKTGRKARIIEMDPIFCDVIRARWEHYQENK